MLATNLFALLSALAAVRAAPAGGSSSAPTVVASTSTASASISLINAPSPTATTVADGSVGVLVPTPKPAVWLEVDEYMKLQSQNTDGGGWGGDATNEWGFHFTGTYLSEVFLAYYDKTVYGWETQTATATSLCTIGAPSAVATDRFFNLLHATPVTASTAGIAYLTCATATAAPAEN